LPQTEFAYNSSTSMSPFFIVYRKVHYHLLDLAKLAIGENFSSVASSLAEQILDVQEEVRLKLKKFNARYKVAADKKRREKVLEEGDMVMIYLKKERIPANSYDKLFRILKKINDLLTL